MDELETPLEPVVPPAGNGQPPADAVEEWREDRAGRQWIPRKDGRPGRINRQGQETIEQARERDSRPKDQRPRRKPKQMKTADPPRKADLKELEAMLAEALKQPALICAMAGDTWAAEHFTKNGPALARNLVAASEHNPWLRRKVEEMASGGEAAMQVIAIMPVIGGLFVYMVPPVIYWLNLPVPAQARLMFGIPPRKEKPPPYANPTPHAESPASAPHAEAA